MSATSIGLAALGATHKTYLVSRACFGIATLNEKIHHVTNSTLPIVHNPHYQAVFDVQSSRIFDLTTKVTMTIAQLAIEGMTFAAIPAASIFIISSISSAYAYSVELERKTYISKIAKIEQDLAKDQCPSVSQTQYDILSHYSNDSTHTASSISWPESIAIATTLIIGAVTSANKATSINGKIDSLVPAILIAVPAAISRYLYDVYIQQIVPEQDQHSLEVLQHLLQQCTLEVSGEYPIVDEL